jgi:hypothetical protein
MTTETLFKAHLPAEAYTRMVCLEAYQYDRHGGDYDLIEVAIRPGRREVGEGVCRNERGGRVYSP